MIANVKKVRTIANPNPKFYKGARAHLEVGFTRIGEQDPYFHVLAGVEHKLRNNRWESAYGRFACCADHEAARRYFPEVANLIRWHLSAIHSGPMHYEANAIFWAEVAQGLKPRGAYDPDPVEAFKHTVVFGALAGDGNPADAAVTASLTTDELRTWLRARLPALMAQFKADVEAAFPGMWESAEALPPGRF